MIKPDGYIDFSNYGYRHIPISRIINQFTLENTNPLKTFWGPIVTQRDIPVYEIYSASGIQGWKKSGYLQAGTVIIIESISIDGYSHVVMDWALQGFVNSRDIDIISYLNSIVSYRIIDDRLYRFIQGHQIEINISIEGFLDNGYRYIRNPPRNQSFNSFFFWEINGDYIFDDNGEFIEVRDFGPSWSEK